MNRNITVTAIVVKTEFLKLGRTVALWLTLLYPLGTVTLASLFHFSMRNHVTPDQVNFINNFNGMSSFFLTFYAMLMVSFFCQMEHRNNMLKHLYALPVPRGAFYAGKMIAALLLLWMAGILMIALIYLSLTILGFISPALKITGAFEHGYLIKLTLKSFLSVTPLLVIHYLISMKMKNVVAAVSIGATMIILPVAALFILGVTGLLNDPDSLKWLTLYDPYAYPYSHVFNFSGNTMQEGLFSRSLFTWLSVSLALAVAGYFELRNRNIK